MPAVEHVSVPASLVGTRARAIVPSAIEEAFAAIDHAGREVISLADGAPPADDLPLAEVRAAVSLALSDGGALAYGSPKGEPALIDAIDATLDAVGVPRRGAVVTAGATQGLFLALYVLASPGEVLFTDAATYCDALTVAATLQLRVTGVDCDAEGMLPDALDAAIEREAAAGRMPGAIYVIPIAHNPLGVSMAAERRRAIVSVALSRGVPIVEDETYALFDDGVAQSFAALAPQMTVRLDSVSKILGPGLRIGWISGPSEVTTAVEQLKASVDVCAPVAVQRAVATLLPDMRALAARQLTRLAERRAKLLRALDAQFDGIATWTRPHAGYFVWLRLPAGLSGRAVTRRALAEGVAVLPGAVFRPDRKDDAIRLSCANRAPADLEEGIARLQRACENGRE